MASRPPVVVDWRAFPPQFRGKEVPKWIAFVLGVITGLGPLIIMCLCLDGMLPSGLRAMFLMHFVAMGLLPVLLVKLVFKDDIYYKCWWNSQLQFHVRSQLKWMLILAAISCLFGVLGGQFVVLRIFTGPKGPVELVHKLKENLDMDDPFTIACGFWFSFINPIIEEWFWRTWLFKELGERCFPWSMDSREMDTVRGRNLLRKKLMASGASFDFPPSPAFLGGNMDNFVIPTEPILRSENSEPLLSHQKIAYDDVRVTLCGQGVIAALYTSYHCVVMWVFTKDLIITALGGIDLWIYGMIFGLLRSDARFGWLGAVGFHAGLDVALMLSFLWW